jgi:hypothetical protein
MMITMEFIWIVKTKLMMIWSNAFFSLMVANIFKLDKLAFPFKSLTAVIVVLFVFSLAW